MPQGCRSLPVVGTCASGITPADLDLHPVIFVVEMYQASGGRASVLI